MLLYLKGLLQLASLRRDRADHRSGEVAPPNMPWTDPSVAPSPSNQTRTTKVQPMKIEGERKSGFKINMFSCNFPPEPSCAMLDFDGLPLTNLSIFILRSPEMFEVVMTYVRATQPESSSVDEFRSGCPGAQLLCILTDVVGEILQYLPLTARRNLGKTSRKFAAFAARELQAEIRFMRTATEAVLSGDTVPYLLDYDRVVNLLYFYVPGDTAPYLLDYDRVVNSLYFYVPVFRTRDGQDRVHKGTRAWEKADWICVLQSNTDSALDCITYLPFSHLFGAVTAYGVWMAYPDCAVEGLSFPNRACMDLGTFLADAAVREVIDRWGSIGSADFGLPCLNSHALVILLGLLE
ncbi:hypothetical protein C8F04DRAFT_1240209 [Mycena alexandri]|uniref:Uncharacterized protein n=1 Tax=Mycena alexandri TaxID=1745969 RepID=A0AAD6WTV6_9AGAR|nr:hypothetical protein C8F04DRAFT_1240209 [Mycena alexandri]